MRPEVEVVSLFPQDKVVSLPFHNDIDVLRHVYDRVNEVRVLRGHTRVKRAEIRDAQLPFEAFDRIEVRPFRSRWSDGDYQVNADDPFRWAICMYLSVPGSNDVACSCRLYVDDWTEFTGMPSWCIGYERAKLVDSPALVKWNALCRRMRLFARMAVWMLSTLEEIQLRPGNVGFRRVKTRFESFQSSQSVASITNHLGKIE